MKKVIYTEMSPKPIGPYSQAILKDEIVFISGQLGIDIKNGTIPNSIESQTSFSLENMKSILSENGMTFDNIVKTTVFVTDLNDFSVVNKIYEDYFGSNKPARSCIQVSALPMGGKVEIEAIACF